jgi:hypothetical protein
MQFVTREGEAPAEPWQRKLGASHDCLNRCIAKWDRLPACRLRIDRLEAYPISSYMTTITIAIKAGVDVHDRFPLNPTSVA